MIPLRISKVLVKCGISYEQQGLIYFLCLNIKRLNNEIQDKILNICVDVAAADYQALYRLLTDNEVNHVYIYSTYFISKTRLFELKCAFYQRAAAELLSNANIIQGNYCNDNATKRYDTGF